MIWLSQNYICVEYDFATLRLNESAWNKVRRSSWVSSIEAMPNI